MSLFPAYSGQENSKQPVDPSAEDQSWLSLSNFPVDLQKSSVLNLSSSSSTKKVHSHFHKKKKKKKLRHESTKRKMEKLLLRKAEEKVEELLSSNSSFYIDRKGSKNNALIPTLMKTDAPLYKKPEKRFVFNFIESKKKLQKCRYFDYSKKIFENDNAVADYLPAQTNENILLIGNAQTQSISQDMESKIHKTIASYNQELAEDPHNEELWLKYVDYQDEIKKFQKQYKGAKEHSNANLEKKLSILDKALTHNPLSEALLVRKLDLLYEINDLDKVSEDLYSMLRRDFGNLTLWIRYIRVTQCTVSRCTVQKVLPLYVKAMEKINFMQKQGILMTEVQLIELFTRCALFLRQAGLWEQLCTLIRLNLQLNLSEWAADHYKVDVQVPENSVKMLEDEILACGLPIYSLWVRIEKLRQRVYWYPVADAECDDPQRVVVPTDVIDLIRPITTQSLNLRIAFVSMHLLKVPLIPLRDCVFRILRLDGISWYLDSAEVLLSAFGSISITRSRFQKHEESIVSCLKDLISYPQYINDDLGRCEFLDFIENMFKKISRNLPIQCETIMLVWWSRLERSLLLADKQPPNRKKRLKSLMRELLKEERHRNSLPLFTEYALMEKELNQNDGPCLKILETALQMYPDTKKKNVFHTSAIKNSLTQLYRVMVEILLLGNHKDRCIRLLISLALTVPEKEIKLNENTIKMALQEYQRVTNETMVEDYTDELELHQLEPQFLVEWVICQAWFLFLTESVWSACAFFEELLRKLPARESNCPITVETYYRELITEALITILHRHCDTNKIAYNLLNESLRKAIAEFPNNMLFLCTLSELETKMNFVSPWWKIEKCLKSNDSVVAKLIMILLCRRRLIAYEQAHLATLKILGKAETTTETSGFSNRIRSLLAKLTSDELTKQCPLIWMIYLQYCALHENYDKYKDVFYMAIENCPWVKVLYMEGAQALPDQVSQIQDLMVEKEIRIHITQDEIDILRDA